ncbi:hypothetical protein QM091_24655 [Enterobacter roggenkampii]|nr:MULTISPECIES: hypothetical protein [Enterobacteriaceae]MCW9210923.1 hypothetical protein [Klebsiella pneumoniae]MDV5186349.1 hypothetical protein [Klebsiella pneumoniae]MDV5296021.1 hypothetical protein [Klebsiella michiganensis]MDV5306670.1 hypothetical protein [Klebsiella pneumoniae]MDV5321970.1 hypothetical protein [Enterobacter roggenkampii]
MSQARAPEIARLPERLDDEVLLARVAALLQIVGGDKLIIPFC